MAPSLRGHLQNMKKKFSGLFFKAVFVLSLISIVPVLIVGYHVMSANSRILQNEILQREQSVAGRLSAVAQQHITRMAQLFSVFTDLHTDLGGHQFLNKTDLDYLRARNSSIFYLSVLNPQGEELFSSGSPADSKATYQENLPAILKTCYRQGKDYVGRVYRMKKGLFALMAFPVRQHLGDTRIEGVLVVEMDLAEMGESLSRAYPLDMNAVVSSSTGEVISYNGAPGGLALSEQPELSAKVKAVNEQLGDRLSGEVTLQNGEKILVATANLPMPGWRVYVDQPANLATKLFVESTLHSLWDLLFIIIGMAAFVVGVSYWVIVPITRPLERLRRAALALRENADVVFTKNDLEIPNNEIGDLATVFLETVEALHVRRQEVLSAQRQLAQVNQRLEKRVEERTRELKQATGELVKAERLAAIGQMASIISHEIRNPLAVISNATRLIKMLVTSPDPKLAKQFGIIEAEIKQANSIISEVLGYARSRELILSTIDVNSYLRDILNSYPISRQITLKMDLESETVRIKIDAEEIKQALRNVISNAVEAMANGGTLTVGTRVGRRAVCIFVQDTGPGLSEEVRRKMFAPFFTTKARGTGLGLAVVGKAIARHKGKLFIKSELGKGTCFQIYLKIYKKTGDTNYGEAS